MKYILIFSAFWLNPLPHWDTIQVEPFQSNEECTNAARRFWGVIKHDGATGYIFECKAIREMEV